MITVEQAKHLKTKQEPVSGRFQDTLAMILIKGTNQDSLKTQSSTEWRYWIYMHFLDFNTDYIVLKETCVTNLFES